MIITHELTNPKLIEFVSKSTNDGVVCRDILRWGIREDSKSNEFKLTDLGNWLLENSRILKQEFASSHLSKSYRLHSKRSFLQARIDDLYNGGLLRKAGTVKSTKNSTTTAIYEITEDGIFLAWILELNSGNRPRQEKAINKFMQFIRRNISTDSVSVFFLAIFDALEKSGMIKQYLKSLCRYALGNWWFDIGDDPVELVMKHFHYEFFRLNQSLVRSVIASLDDETRKLLLFHFKISFESGEVGQREWEIERLKNISNYSAITVMWHCYSCGSAFPKAVDILDYFPYAYTYELPTVQDKCPKCGADDAYWNNM